MDAGNLPVHGYAITWVWSLVPHLSQRKFGSLTRAIQQAGERNIENSAVAA